MELIGVKALDLTQSTMDELLISDAIAVRRITTFLLSLSHVIDELAEILMSMWDGYDLQVFYDGVRSWFKGEDSERSMGVFDPIEDSESIEVLKELSGAGAGQSYLIHALDVFLGLDTHSPSPPTLPSGEPGEKGKQEPFLKRMQKYMQRHHRAFLTHLASSPYPLRDLVLREGSELREAYNEAVGSL